MLTRQIILDAQQQTSVLHVMPHPTDALENKTFLERVRNGDKEAVQDAIMFLEVDPWYFRSGYLKARLCRALKAAPLTASDQRRLLNMAYIAAMGKHRQEFREICSLARKLATPEFTQKVRSRAAMYDPQSKNSFQYLLRKLEAQGTR